MKFRRLSRYAFKHRLLPVLLIFASIFAISIALNLCALEIQSALRAYVAGESRWSKSQRDAVISLELYARTRNPEHLMKFNQAMTVPLGFRMARMTLLEPDHDKKIVVQSLLQAGTPIEDIPGVIRLFECCSRYGYFQSAIHAWAMADELVLELERIAHALEGEITSSAPINARIEQLRNDIEVAIVGVEPAAEIFTGAIGNGARAILQWLRVITIGVISLLILLGAYISWRIMAGIHKSEKQYRALFNCANDAVFLFERSHGKILEANHEAEQLTHRLSYELTHFYYQDFFPHLGKEHTLPEYLEGHRQTTMTIDSHHIQVEISGSLVEWNDQPAYLAIVRDISDQLKTERELRVSANAMAHMAEGMVITDSEYRIISVNLAFTTITGFTAEEVLQQSVCDFMFKRSDANYFQTIIATIILAGSWHGQIYHQRSNGEIYPIQMSMSAVCDEHDRISHYVAVFNDISESKDYEQRLQHLVRHDLLTQLSNRSTFYEHAERTVDKALRTNTALALLFIDLDGFKLINDAYGHAAGDHLLRTIAGRIQGCLRKTDLVARLGGDEFTILLEDTAERDDAMQLANQLLLALSENIIFEGKDISTFVSIGISFLPEDTTSLQALLTNAYTALCEAKHRGRNNVQVFNAGMIVNAASRLQLSSSLKRAIELSQFELYYQPCVHIENNQLVTVEALLRWNHPVLGSVAPDIFIPLAEEIGLIGNITEWVLKTACNQGMDWIEKGLIPIQIAVNISPCNFWDAALCLNIKKILAETGWQAKRLCLEITETALRNQDKSKSMLQELNAMGMRLAIDDFGVGYSSLSYLKHFPVHYLKIDRSFIMRSVQDPSDAAITRTIIALAKNLGLTVIAEGVETAEQGEFLRAEGCDEAQGYFFGRPMPAWKLESLLMDMATI